ncbi:mechanosensitive ion channel family protein [Chitinophaga nivalis]|uniref:Mechanosensitive ion channel family protein n=1 Tax=Chitinophaga nivalis TaxID=2991709 RepID=A0ABT3IUC4_9BACT|nr:mechanosensitive ion channel family protein [Chitinophaga nivalis]MCW3462731.1 mechanosensitive ion channel family protein [Chitinophaga nivalis]MCW3487578.1 mechanosensitive ion channel family protein [Chitinophaga nivalis]
MNDFLNHIFLDNPVQDYLILLGVLLFVFFVKRFISKGLATILFRLVKHWSPQIEEKDFIALLLRPLEYFLLLVTFMLTIDRFTFPQVLNVHVYNKITLQNVTDTLLSLAFSMSIIWILLRLIDFIALVLEKKADLTEDKTDNQFIVFFRDFFKAIIFIMGAIAFIRILFGPGLVEKIVAGLGIGAAALALAAKESIENLIGSFIIFFDKPFRVGDSVKVDSFQGTVEKIGLRSTRIRTLEKTFVTVPNKKMVDSILDNLSLRTQQRVALKLELGSEAPAESLLNLLKDTRMLLKENPNVLAGFTVNLNDFTRDTYSIQIIFNTYIIDGNQYAALRETVTLGIIRLLGEHGLKLPNNTTIVNISGRPELS